MAESDARQVRKFIFDFFLENARAPVLEEIMKRFGLGRDAAAKALEELEIAHHVIRVPGTNRILMANPFSALDTPFRVRVDDKDYFGACAWDAVAYHVMLGRNTQVHSFCHHCAESIEIEFGKGTVTHSKPSHPIVYLSPPAAKWWENIVLTCSNNMVFFSSDEHLDDWLEKNPGPKGAALSLDQTLKISIPIYRDKLKLDYTRPSKEELMSYWGAMGLEGEFWKL
jgi:Alkylmercury lyase